MAIYLNPLERISSIENSMSAGNKVLMSGVMNLGDIKADLVIDRLWLSMILDPTKCWETRSIKVKAREHLALIEKGSGSVVGVAKLIDAKDPFTIEEMANRASQHQIPPEIYRAPGYKWH